MIARFLHDNRKAGEYQLAEEQRTEFVVNNPCLLRGSTRA